MTVSTDWFVQYTAASAIEPLVIVIAQETGVDAA